MSNTTIPTLNTKGGLKFKVRFDTTISASDVVNHITNDILQLPVKASLRTIHGPGKGCYVIAVLAFAAEDIAVTTTPDNFTDKVLTAYGSGTKYKKDVLDKIKPFMLPTPEQFALSMRNPTFAKQLADIGIWGDNLKEINTFSSLRYSPQTGYYVIYLDAEKIIKHMAEDPLDDEIKGTLSINAVYGEKDEAIRWAVTIDAGNGTGSVSKRPFNVTIDQIIATAR
jgi:hypothetical protein